MREDVEVAEGVVASVKSVLKLRELRARDQAEAAFARAVALFGRLPGPAHSRVKRTLGNLLEEARTAIRPQDLRRAARALERAEAMLAQNLPS